MAAPLAPGRDMVSGATELARHVMHPLRVAGIEQLTEDSVTITFDVPDHLEELYRFEPGQHIAVARPDHQDSRRRSYSVCSPQGGPLRVAVKRLPNGAFSSYAQKELRAGDTLQVLPPDGRFTTELYPGRTRHYAAIAAGSGITPVMSIIASILKIEPNSRCTLVYGNRTTASIMFLEELQDLKNRHCDRLQIVHILSREEQASSMASGRIDGDKLAALFRGLVCVEDVDEWFLCGPQTLVEQARETLRARGVPAASIRRELFHAEGVEIAAPSTMARPATGTSSVSLVLHGRTTEIAVARDGLSILDAALPVRADAPYACKGGVCGTCRARVVEGEVRVLHNYALEEDEIAAGLVLACQARPISHVVVLDFDTLRA